MKKNSKFIVKSGIVAALYAVLTLIIPVASYGPLQFRFSEALTLLAYYNPAFIPGLTIGNALANLASPFGIYDVIFGTLASFLSLYSMSKIKNIHLASIMPAIFNGIIIGLEIYILSGRQESFFVVGAQIFITELIIVAVIGVLLFKALEKNKTFMQRLTDF